MALNIQTFKTRALTAIIFVAVMLLGLLVNYQSFLLLFLIIHIGCWLEYQKLVGLIDKDYQQINNIHKYLVIITGIGFTLFMLNNSFKLGNFGLHELGWWLLIIGAIVLPIQEVLLSKQPNAKLIMYSFFGLLYISLCCGLMMDLWGKETYNLFKTSTRYFDRSISGGYGILPIIIITSMWINDTMAYLVGSFIGKTPFSKISPKKTWEGTIGGIILCTIIVGLLGNWYLTASMDNIYSSNLQLNHTHLYVIAFVAAVTGTAGDLLESKIKRLANVKDSGSFMPGHGGFLDRFDSLLVATPFVWLYIQMFM